MKKIIALLLILANAGTALTALAEETGQDINLGGVEKTKIKMTPKVVREEKSLALDKDTAMKGIINLQQQKDLEDIENLWKATNDNNNIIKFAMKKLNIPADQRRIHSSLMAKSLSALISGASFIPAMFGSNYGIQSASYATGRLANSFINRKNTPQEVPLTDTELIELAGMIESLQDTIINSYYNYKAILSQIKETREQLVLYNKNYSEALRNNDEMEILVSSSMYDDLLFQEYQLIQQAKKYQMDLQRLAGKKAVENLNLYQYAFKNELFTQTNINEKNLPQIQTKNKKEAE